MPRTSLGGVTSAFERVQRQAHGLLNELRSQIQTKENELKRLRDEEERLTSLLGGSRIAPSPAAPRSTATRVVAARSVSTGSVSSAGGRIDWRAVLKQVPRQFKASDVRMVRGLKDKRPSEIFAAITRWIDAGLAKRKTRGLYERSGV